MFTLYVWPYVAALTHINASCVVGLETTGAVSVVIAGTFNVLVINVKSAIVTALNCVFASVIVDK